MIKLSATSTILNTKLLLTIFYNYSSPNNDRRDHILREKSLAIYFEVSQFIRIRTFNFIVSKIYVDKRSRVR